MIGPGKYNEHCATVRTVAQARGVLLLVIAGNQGTGFECQGDPEIILELPGLLRGMAEELEKSHEHVLDLWDVLKKEAVPGRDGP